MLLAFAAASAVPQPSVGPLAIAPSQVARDVAANEIKLIEFDSAYLRYKIHTRDSKGNQVRDVIETADGTVARVIRKGDHPLTPAEDTAEHQRLQAMLDAPAAFRRHIDKDRTGKKLAVELVRLLPDAMNFEYVPGQPQREHAPPGSNDELVIDFAPNPKWVPPTMTSQALTGVRGRVWVDRKSHNLTRLEANIFQGVNFGFGMLAHIYPGGKLFLEQRPVTDNRWIVDHFIEQVTLRAMLIKTIREDVDLEAFDFNPIRKLNYPEAIHLLFDTPLPTN